MGDFKKKNKYLIKNTLLIFLGNFGSKLIYFFLVPFYTNFLSTSEYGTIDFFVILCTIIIPIITMNISESVMRFEMDKDKDESSIIGSGILITSDYAILIVIYILTLSLSQILLCFIRGKELLLKYSIISIAQTVIIVIANIILLCGFKIGINGYLISYIIGYLFTSSS